MPFFAPYIFCEKIFYTYQELDMQLLNRLAGLEGITSLGGGLSIRDSASLCEDRAFDLQSQLLDSRNVFDTLKTAWF